MSFTGWLHPAKENEMRKLYEKNEILFAVLWILVYCFVLIPIRGNFGDGSIWMTLALLVIAAGITVFMKTNHLEEKYGLDRWPENSKRYTMNPSFAKLIKECYM